MTSRKLINNPKELTANPDVKEIKMEFKNALIKEYVRFKF